ncbi:MAG: tetratricopeptide repeat protein, partial [Lentisphaerae bacterium]|nr:tetratricopeptide repeat protein [Lentisphaerota bacterium]
MRALVTACLLVFAAGYALAETPESVFRQAAQHEREGDIARSIDAFKRFLKEFPKHSQTYEARFRLAKNQDRIGMIDEAIKNLERV